MNDQRQVIFSDQEIIELQRIAQATLFTRLILWPGVIGILTTLAVWDDAARFIDHLKEVF